MWTSGKHCLPDDETERIQWSKSAQLLKSFHSFDSMIQFVGFFLWSELSSVCSFSLMITFVIVSISIHLKMATRKDEPNLDVIGVAFLKFNCCKFTISFGRLSFSLEIFRIQEILGTSLRLPFLHPWHTLTCLCRQDDCAFTLKAIEDLTGFNQWYRREQGQVHTYLLPPAGRQGQE